METKYSFSSSETTGFLHFILAIMQEFCFSIAFLSVKACKDQRVGL